MMRLNSKEILWLIAMGLFYIGIGVLSFWFSPIYLFTWILGVPFSLYVYKRGTNILSFSMPIVVLVVLTAIGMGKAAMMITLLLFIPSFICGICYNKQINLSKNIILSSVAYLFGWTGMLIAWNFIYKIGVIDRFYSFTNAVETYYLKELSNQYSLIFKSIKEAGDIQNTALGQNPKKIMEMYPLYRLAFKQFIYLIQYLFPVIIFVFGLFASLIQILFTKLILKSLDWKAPSLKQILNIGFTPATVGVLGLTWLIRGGMDSSIYPEITMATDNLLVIFSIFMFIMGILFTIHVIKNSRTGLWWKALVSILSLLSVIFSPFLFVTLGFLEAIFNFRKKERFL